MPNISHSCCKSLYPESAISWAQKTCNST